MMAELLSTPEDSGKKYKGLVDRVQIENLDQPRILVVDDENGPRQALRMLLKEDYDVRLAPDAFEALNMLEREPYALVITDLRMPRRSGVELLELIKQSYPETQVIILTGYAHLETAVQAVEFGAFAYIEKPFDNGNMLRHVQAGIKKYQQEHEYRVFERLALEANRFETLGRLVAGIIHDMGTPLSVLGSQLEMIMSNPGRADVEERYKTMNTQVRHCSDMVRTTMNFLRYDNQPVSPFYLNDIVETCLQLGHPMLRGQNVTVTRNLMENNPPAIGDLVMVRQAILNLITNACHAMASQERPQEIVLRTWVEDGDVCLSVADSGPGVPQENREKIFESFFTTKGNKGTGLGLAVVRNVMRHHKGCVTLEDAPGGGAQFKLSFPVASQEDIMNLFCYGPEGHNSGSA